MKRFLSLLLIGCLFVMIVGCSKDGSNKTSSPSKDNGTNSNEEAYTLNVSYPVYGDAPSDLLKVQEKVNEITMKEINAKVEFKPVAISAMANTYTLAASSGEKQDLIMLLPGYNYLTQFAGSNMIRPLDELLEKHGKDITATYGDIFDAAKVDGKLYAIPGKDPVVTGRGFYMSDSIAKKYNIDVTNIKTMDDLDPILEKVHAGEPDLQAFFPMGVAGSMLNFDTIGNYFGVLRNGGVDNLKVVNMFETKEYSNAVKKVREWYQKGYISKDFATEQSSPQQLMDAGKLFAAPVFTDPSQRGLGDKAPKYTVTLHDPVEKTETYQLFLWAVPTIAERPDKSIEFLNLVFKNQDLANLLKFGIDGEHYEKNSDGTIDTSKGIGKFMNNWYIWGDTEKLLIPEKEYVGFGGDIDKYKQAKEEWVSSTKRSKAFGFIFNSDPVKTEIAACTAITDQYTKLLEGGALDPDEYIKLVNEKLYDAGLQKIIDEKQRQLNEWAKKQK
jgi:putative aldouronate transport system substrate-binding protein